REGGFRTVSGPRSSERYSTTTARDTALYGQSIRGYRQSRPGRDRECETESHLCTNYISDQRPDWPPLSGSRKHCSCRRSKWASRYHAIAADNCRVQYCGGQHPASDEKTA